MDEAVRIAYEAGLPFTGLRDFRPDERLWHSVPSEWALREGVLPLLVVGDRLKLAASRPDPDLSGLNGNFAGIDVVIAPAREIEAALAQAPAAPARPRGRSRGRSTERAAVTDPSAPRRLGDLLVAHGAATDAEVARALDEQARTGGRLGDVLVARDAVSEERLEAVLAEQLGLPVVDLTGYEPDAEALDVVPEELQRRLRCVPLAVDEAAIYLAVAEPLDEQSLRRLGEATGLEPRCFLARRSEVDDLLQALHGERWAAMARLSVAGRYPEESGAQPIRPLQALVLALALAAAVAGLAVDGRTTGLVLVALAGAAIVLPAALALLLAAAGWRATRRRTAPDPPVKLPLTTLLLPVAGGAAAAERAGATLAALDHPRARLEVLLLCPAGDVPAIRAARALIRERPHRLVVVPADVPATRAGVLAYGLLLARGEQVAVLDPGDVPAPGLLIAADAALAAGGRRVVAAQTALVPPAGPGLTAGWLAAECAAWHGLLAPGLARAGLPLPLSSTGVVLRRAALDDVEGWDPACLAEGVDLGLRLHKAGFRATVADTAIGVSGLSRPGSWMRMHARWWRGALTAYLVQLRHPLRAIHRMGPVGAAVKLLLGAGAIAAPLVWPGVLAVAALGALDAAGLTGAILPRAMTALAGAEVLAASAVLVLLGVVGALRRRCAPAARAAVLAPVGFTLVALSAWLGVAGVVAAFGQMPGEDRLGRW